MFNVAAKLMRELYIVKPTQNEPVRLIGLRLSRLCNDVTRSKPITSFISPRASEGESVVQPVHALEVKTLVCPVCSAKFDLTESLMNYHIKSCSVPSLKRKRSLPKTAKKRMKTGKRIEDFYSKAG